MEGDCFFLPHPANPPSPATRVPAPFCKGGYQNQDELLASPFEKGGWRGFAFSSPHPANPLPLYFNTVRTSTMLTPGICPSH